jgi:hypothetical protein
LVPGRVKSNMGRRTAAATEPRCLSSFLGVVLAGLAEIISSPHVVLGLIGFPAAESKRQEGTLSINLSARPATAAVQYIYLRGKSGRQDIIP